MLGTVTQPVNGFSNLLKTHVLKGLLICACELIQPTDDQHLCRLAINTSYFSATKPNPFQTTKILHAQVQTLNSELFTLCSLLLALCSTHRFIPELAKRLSKALEAAFFGDELPSPSTFRFDF